MTGFLLSVYHLVFRLGILLAIGVLTIREPRPAQGWQATGTVVTVSGASFDQNLPVAPESIVSAFGANLAPRVESAPPGQPLPTDLAGTTVTVNGQLAQLFFVSPGQINFLIPHATALGRAAIVVRSGAGAVSQGAVTVAAVSPGIFQVSGVAVGQALRYRADGFELTSQSLIRFVNGESLPTPVDRADLVYLVLYGTGLRAAAGGSVTAKLGGMDVSVDYAGPQGSFAGLDQLNIRIDPVINSLQGRGRVRLALHIPGAGASNSVEVEVASPTGQAPPRLNTLSSGRLLAGSPIVIEGNGFSATATENVVRIGGVEARVISASATRLTVLVPFGAQSGSVTVRTPQGESISQETLTVRTSISGVIEDTLRRPLSGVIVRMVNSTVETTTGAEGQFILPDVPEGNQTLQIDGSRVAGAFPYPAPRIKLRVLGNRDNQIGSPVALQRIDGPSLAVGTPTGEMPLALTGSTGQQTRRIETGGVAFEVPNNISVAFPDGARTGQLTLSIVENSRTPVRLPPGQFSSVVAQVTALGATLLPGAKLTFPNRDGYAAGSAVDIIRLDQSANSDSLGSFVKTGTAVVSADGQRIETAPNAITEASIYLVTNPRTTTTVVGRVTESDGRPVREAVVISRGQQAATDGNGAFILRNVPAGTGETLTVEASFARPNGTVARGQRGNLSAVPGGITALPSDLTLQAEVGNRPPIISFEPLGLLVNPGEIREKDFIAIDPEGQTISVSRTGPSFSSVITKGNGLYTLQLKPGTNDTGTYNLRISATDSLGETTVIDISVRVNGRPVANPQTVTVLQNTPRAITLSGSDPDGDPLTFTVATDPRNGRLTGTAPSLTYTPNTSFAGADSFTFSVSDGAAQSTLAVVTIGVSPVNQPPVLTVPGPQTITVLTPLTFTVTATDPDASHLLTFTASQLPGGATFTQIGPNSAQFSWTPATAQAGSYTVRFTVTDNGTPQLSDTRTVPITVTLQPNRAPTLTVPQPQTAAAGQPLSFTVSASDPDSGQTLTFTHSNLPSGAAISQTGPTSVQFIWTPTAAQIGSYTPGFTVTDNGSPQLTDTKTVAITVTHPNRAPILTVPAAQTVTAGQLLSFVVTGTDPDSGQTLSFTTSSLPGGASFTPSATGGQFNWTPTIAQVASYTVIFTVTDNGTPALSDSKAVTITVTQPNRAPTLTVPATQTVVAGQSLTFTVAASDPDSGQALSISASNMPIGATFSQNTPTSSQFTWTPTLAQIGSYTTIFTVADNGIPVLSDSRTVTITVTQPNRAPTLTVPAAQTVAVGQPLVFTVTASDPDSGQTLNITASNTPSGAGFNQITATSGQFTWTPTATQVGSYTVSFTVRDNGTPQLSDTKTVTVTVPNRAPTLTVPTTQTVAVGQPLIFTVTASDPDSGQTVAITATSLPSGASFSQNTATSGQFTWTPTAAQVGSYTVSFTVRDSGIPQLSDTKTVMVTVPNRAPTLTVPAAQTVTVGQLLSFTVTASDPDIGQALTITAGNPPLGANFSQNTAASAQFTWTPTAAQAGNYTVSFTVRDNGTPVGSSNGTVDITVLPVGVTLMNFTTATVSPTGVITRFAGTPVQRYFEDLGGGLSVEMIVIPAGTFTMGSPDSEPGRSPDEGPQQLVRVGRFAIGKFELTQAQWRALMSANPSVFKGDNLPVESITRDEAQEFCRRLNTRLGLSGSTVYRLPSDAEWEYAARAGTTTQFSFGVTITSEIVNYNGEAPYGQAPVGVYRKKTVDVGSLGVANPWGLFDMNGNVWEWCEDDYQDTLNGVPADGRPRINNPRTALGVIRSGSWNHFGAFHCRSAHRDGLLVGERNAVGLRLARTLP